MRWSLPVFSSAIAIAACTPTGATAGGASAANMVELAVLPYEQPAHLMGFAMDDRAYLARIPAAARTVPRGVLTGRFFYDSEYDYERGLANPDDSVAARGIVAFRSYEAGRAPDYVVRRVGRGASGDYDQWYLLDVTSYIRAVVSVHRETRRAYFYEIIGVGHETEREHFIKGGDHCYRCHPSGLRSITPRPDDPLVDWALVEAINRDILDQGVVDFGADVDRVGLGEPVGACVDCHDGEQRGVLYGVHHQMIRYRIETTRAMPPDEPLSAPEAAALMTTICDSQGGCAIE
jgi:hypothetical protein